VHQERETNKQTDSKEYEPGVFQSPGQPSAFNERKPGNLPTTEGGYRNGFWQLEGEFVVPAIFGPWDAQGQNRNRVGIIGPESPEVHPHLADKYENRHEKWGCIFKIKMHPHFS